LEDSAWVLPYFGFDWRIGERLSLASDGAGVALHGSLSDELSCFLGARYELRQFRLNPDGALPDGVVHDDEIRLECGLAWRVGEHATLALEGGALLWQETAFLDDGGAKLGEVETDPAPFATVSLRLGY
jgi:hypothetical protein